MQIPAVTNLLRSAQVNTAPKLAEIFAKQRSDKLDLSGVAVIDPQLSLMPSKTAVSQKQAAPPRAGVPSKTACAVRNAMISPRTGVIWQNAAPQTTSAL